MISIITPVYNAEKYLPTTIESILSQTYNCFEWICVDDGSKDNSLHILSLAAESDIRIKVIHQENGGVSKARNTAICAATGDWITFLDADDEVSEDWLMNYFNAINPDIDIIFQGAIIRNDNNTIKFQLKDKKFTTIQFIRLWQNKYHDLGSAWCKMIKTSIIKDNYIRFPVGISNFEDWIFLTQCLCYASGFQTISGTGYIYNHQNSHLTGNMHRRRSFISTYNITRNWYLAIQPLKFQCNVGYNTILKYISSLMMQTLIELYREKDNIQVQRLGVLDEFKHYDFILTNCTLMQKITRILWFRKFPLFTDHILRIWRLA